MTETQTADETEIDYRLIAQELWKQPTFRKIVFTIILSAVIILYGIIFLLTI